jgi:hypothetical protein
MAMIVEEVGTSGLSSQEKGISLSRSDFRYFFKKAKPRITFDFIRLFYRAFAKMSVLMFDFCHSYMGGPKEYSFRECDLVGYPKMQ